MAQPKVGTFTGPGAIGNQSITGLGFRPGGLILYASGDTGDNLLASDALICIGFTDGTNQACASTRSDDGAATSLTTRVLVSDDLINFPSNAADTEFPAIDIVSLDADGFTVNWLTTTAFKIFYVAFDSVEHHCSVGTIDVNNTTGNQSKTGLTFQPTLYLLAASINNTTEGAVAHGMLSLGAANGSEQIASVTLDVDNKANMEVKRSPHDDCCLVQRNLASPYAISLRLTHVSMNSDGFTFNVATAPASSTRIIYFAIDNVTSKLDWWDTSTGTGNKSYTGASFTGELLGFWGSIADALPVDESVQASERYMVGFGDGTTQSVVGFSAGDTAATAANARVCRSTRIWEDMNTSASQELVGTLSSFNSNGFTINFTVNAGSRRRPFILLKRTTILATGPSVGSFVRSFPNPSKRNYPSLANRGYPRS